MNRFYIKHLLCAIVDAHFGHRLSGTSDDAPLTLTLGKMLYTLREAFELGQDVRRPRG